MLRKSDWDHQKPCIILNLVHQLVQKREGNKAWNSRRPATDDRLLTPNPTNKLFQQTPNKLGQQFINKLFVYLLSDIGQEIIKINKRSYGDELDKFEPRDLNDSLCPSQKQFEMISDEDAEEVISIAQNDHQKAILMSNALIKRLMDSQQCAALDGNSAAP